MFVLRSFIKIGNYSFRGGINDLKINKSVTAIMDTATLKIPALSRVKNDDGTLPTSSQETAKLFKEGDKVEIKLGYNGNLESLKTEFVGFVRRVNIATPIELELEGYGWQMRRVYLQKSYKKTTVKEVLTDLIKGTDIVLSSKIADFNLTNFYIHNGNGLEVLEYLKTKCLQSVYFIGNELYVGLQQTEPRNGLKPVKYRLGYNVIRDNQLKYRLPEDNRVLVRVYRKPKKGKAQVVYEVGDKGGSIRELRPPNLDDAKCKELADSALRLAKRTGYEGKITGFLEPYCDFGYSVELDDPKFGERKGRYFVSAVEITFGVNGAKRMVEITYRLDGQ